MKKILLSVGLVFGLVVCASAYTRIVEDPITSVSNAADGTLQTIVISTSVWTRVTPTTSTALLDRDGIILNNPTTNTDDFVMLISTDALNAPSISTNTAVLELTPAGGPLTILLADDLTIWGNSRHTASETIYLQEYKQR